MALKPTYDKVLILPDEQKPPYEENKDHKIILPDKYRYGAYDVAHIGTVLAKGPAVDLPLKKGDRVYYGKFSFAKFVHKEKTYVIVKQDDILTVLDG